MTKKRISTTRKENLSYQEKVLKFGLGIGIGIVLWFLTIYFLLFLF